MDVLISIWDAIVAFFGLLKWWTIPAAALCAAVFDAIFLSSDRYS